MNDHLLSVHINNWRRCNYSHFPKEVQEGAAPAAQLMVNYPQPVYHSSTHKRILQLSWTKKCLLFTPSLHSLFQTVFTGHLLWIQGSRGFNYIAIPVPWSRKQPQKTVYTGFWNDFQRKFTSHLKIRLSTLKTLPISFGHKHCYLYLFYVVCQTWTWKALN